MDILNQDHHYFACGKLDYSYMTQAISILKVAIVTSRAHDELCLHHSSIDDIVHNECDICLVERENVIFEAIEICEG